MAGSYIRTDKHKEIMSLAKMGNKSKLGHHWEWSNKVKTKISNKLFGRFRGKDSPHWKGGASPIIVLIRCSSKYLKWRQDIFIRDRFTCQECGDNRGGNLHAHHKKQFSILLEEVKKYLPLLDLYEGAMIYEPLWNLDNGIILCEKCHRKTFRGK